MKRFAVALVLLGCLGMLASCGHSERQVRMRVTFMMDGWLSGGTSSGGDIQDAICMWYNGSHKLPLDHLKHAQVAFDDWRREKSLYRDIDSWAITEVSEEDDAMVPTSVVSLKIDGQPYRIRVAAEQPIEWIR